MDIQVRESILDEPNSIHRKRQYPLRSLRLAQQGHTARVHNIPPAFYPNHDKNCKKATHTLYADDITIWATKGSRGQKEAVLQEAATWVEKLAAENGQQCAPDKSEII